MVPVIVRSSDVGVPTLTNTRGSLINVLKQVLVTGIAYRSCTITRSGAVATVTMAGHGFSSYQNVTITGANQSEYNGQKAITVVDTNTFTFAVTGTPATPATGTITAGLQAAGWTVAIEDAPNFKIIFRNDSVTGSGRYFRFQEDGYCTFDPAMSTYYKSNVFTNMAHLVGCTSYSDIDTPVLPFPRVLAGGTLHDVYAYGVGIAKTRSNTTPSGNTLPWMIVADNRTCHLFLTSSAGSSTVLPTDFEPDRTYKQRGVVSFGDVRSFAPNNSVLAKAFVKGGDLRAFNFRTSGNYEGVYSASGMPLLIPFDDTCYLDSSYEGSSKTVQGTVKPEFNDAINQGGYWSGNCRSTAVEGEYAHYPHPGTFDFETERLLITEKLDDPIRTFSITANHFRYAQGWIPGVRVSPHSTATTLSYRVGDELTVVTTQAGKRFLIYSLAMWVPAGLFAADTILNPLIAIELDDWWT